MCTANCHENGRVSLETNTSRSDESIRTGFSYEDSTGDQSRATFSFEGTLPVQFTIIQKQADLIMNDKALISYEIDRCLLQNMVTIGEGAFGVVAKATLLKKWNSTERQTVAVKMLKGFQFFFKIDFGDCKLFKGRLHNTTGRMRFLLWHT